MALIDTLEYKFGRFAIPGITRVLALFQVIMYVLILIDQKLDFANLLVLDRTAILQGQVWRLFTYMFLPITLRPINFFFFIWALLWIGDALERTWGSFRLNLFVFSGMMALTVVAFVLDAPQTNWVLMATFLLAFATLAPDYEISLYGILPVQAKYIALISVGFLSFYFLRGDWLTRASILAGVANYLLFFGPSAISNAFFRSRVASRRNRFESAVREFEGDPVHLCKVCGRTEQSDPSLDFRIAKDGEEYCVEHLPGRASVN